MNSYVRSWLKHVLICFVHQCVVEKEYVIGKRRHIQFVIVMTRVIQVPVVTIVLRMTQIWLLLCRYHIR